MIFNVVLGAKDVTATLDAGYPADLTVNAGDEASFKVVVTATGFPKEHTFQWFVNEKAVEGATGDSYIRDTSEDKGIYSVRCEVKNKAGTVVSRTAMLTVNKPHVLDESYPKDASVTVGKSATFEAKISETGYPDVNYQWYVNDKAIEGATSSTYTRTGAAVGSEKIHCVVSNSLGTVQTRTATFTVSAEYVFLNGNFQNGYGIDWTSNSNVAGSSVSGTWNLYSEGTGSWAAAWVTTPINVTGKNKLIFTVSGITSTTTDPNNYGYSRMGVTNAANLGNTNMVAQVSVYNVPNSSAREFVVDLKDVSGDVYVKILIDKTNTNYNQDNLYVSAIRFE